MTLAKNSYFPIQIPYLLNKDFNRSILYSEEIDSNFEELIICFWKSIPRNEATYLSKNVIVPDGCIDLVVDFTNKRIGLSGMSKTNFDFSVKPDESYFGLRFLPGAVSEFFDIDGSSAMDRFIPISEIDSYFDSETFWKSKNIDDAILFVKKYIEKKHKKKILDPAYILLFQSLYKNDTLPTVEQLAKEIAVSTRQLQRIFLKKYGLTPNKLLSVIRFQQTLHALKSPNGQTGFRNLENLPYYDQPHMIKSIKKNIGITPTELIDLYSDKRVV
ncbi:DUF6597 domain-containing transcriptional factor [Enterococcus rivorum]|uniref:HTH araC/xylS-type domain-containing protein n=1 Tax=Enterococcus rivorum TaxID=762845 RepID=A0A1E5KV86_9ENTE|nr:DUF6597 domain-containing transcriptional factor [Enterococcus rivorum]MBP2100207.1 AraC-like DNA-binding protein [Enterococcus rivorum]OEH81783.1 hypothetical protein BCR26_03215 [Enterococcus rivorum]